MPVLHRISRDVSVSASECSWSPQAPNPLKGKYGTQSAPRVGSHPSLPRGLGPPLTPRLRVRPTHPSLPELVLKLSFLFSRCPQPGVPPLIISGVHFFNSMSPKVSENDVEDWTAAPKPRGRPLGTRGARTGNCGPRETRWRDLQVPPEGAAPCFTGISASTVMLHSPLPEAHPRETVPRIFLKVPSPPIFSYKQTTARKESARKILPTTPSRAQLPRPSSRASEDVWSPGSPPGEPAAEQCAHPGARTWGRPSLPPALPSPVCVCESVPDRVCECVR